MPEIASVKLDVYDNNRNSLTSIANATNAPDVIFIANKMPVVDADESDEESDNLNSVSPSNPIVNGKIGKIIHGCMKYIISIGLCRPSFDFCIINCANVHRMPLVIDAKIKNANPSILNCVDLYVNIHRPAEINTTVNISSQLCKFNMI